MALFNVEPIPYEAAVRLALDRFRRDDVETSWSNALSSSQGDRAVAEMTSEEGMISEEDLDLFDYAETAQEAWELISEFHRDREDHFPEF